MSRVSSPPFARHVMKSPHAALHPALLSPGTEVGPWRVVAWAGQGVQGAVYQAVRIGQEQVGPVALKVAMLPRDPRFAREVTLLSRVDHPSIPRLLDSGEWQHPGGTSHPYLVMQWVDGVPLYDWARLQVPAPEQVLRLLAQLARALQALHAQDGLHRDVKGDNVLVRHTDGRAVLTDFGAGFYEGAATLTPPTCIPSTPAYRSPEAALIELRSLRDPMARHTAGPADDLYALGVTACQLVTGEYPEFGEPSQDESGNWRVETVVPPPALLLEARVAPLLRALILRMLSVRPEERGTAEELAELLEQSAESLVLVSAPANLVEEPPQASAQPREEPSAARGAARLVRPRAYGQARRLWLATAAASLALATWAWWSVPPQSEERPSFAQKGPPDAGRADAGTAGLGDAASIVSEGESPKSSVSEVMAQETLPELLPGQTRPDAKGRCPRKRQVVLNGGCWLAFPLEPEECVVVSGHMFKGMCYVPFVLPGRQPTSEHR
jgi:serine/threonine protein kinase